MKVAFLMVQDAVECMKWLPDAYKGEFYDFKNKQNE